MGYLGGILRDENSLTALAENFAEVETRAPVESNKLAHIGYSTHTFMAKSQDKGLWTPIGAGWIDWNSIREKMTHLMLRKTICINSFGEEGKDSWVSESSGKFFHILAARIILSGSLEKTRAIPEGFNTE